jgi:hypothetical protein
LTDIGLLLVPVGLVAQTTVLGLTVSVNFSLSKCQVAREEEILDAVFHKHRFDLSTLNALDTIRSCIPLFGEEIVQDWKLCAQEYPVELAKQVIREHLSSFSIGELLIEILSNVVDRLSWCASKGSHTATESSMLLSKKTGAAHLRTRHLLEPEQPSEGR